MRDNKVKMKQNRYGSICLVYYLRSKKGKFNAPDKINNVIS